MIEGVLGIIDKMRIEVYKKRDFAEKNIIKTIFVQVNPSGYTINQEIEFCEGQAIGSSSQNLKFNKKGSEEVSFSFLFDSSGVIPPPKIKEGKVEKPPLSDEMKEAFAPATAIPFEQAASVEKDLNEFKELVAGYNGETHQPNYLRLLWGSYQLECRLTSINIEYKLFRRDGRPIRANVVCKFKKTQTIKEMGAQQNRQSSDVTHELSVRQDDLLPLMAERIYDQNNYYIDVAKANKLLSFRKIETGTPLRFPPIK